MEVRQDVFETYWRFASLRQESFFSRISGSPPPWSGDEILKTYKFCNAYRASDRVSQYLIREVIYRGDQDEEEVVFRILLFKIFNRIETWKYLISRVGEMLIREFSLDRFAKLLAEVRGGGQPIYTNAYMSCATKAYGFEKKHENHLALIEHMILKDKITGRIIQSRGLSKVYELLVHYPLIGRFMAYQLAIDLNYSPVINFSEDDFTIAGPGAERGIRKCFRDSGGRSNEALIHWMTENQEQEFERLGIKFQDLFGRRLHAIDCQGLFCETDKYCRVAYPELKSNRSRIKARFKPNSEPINYFYPPKWRINNLEDGPPTRQHDKTDALMRATNVEDSPKEEIPKIFRNMKKGEIEL